MLKNGDLDFNVLVEDLDYNNNDNPYGEIKLHRYTNIQNKDNITGEVYRDDKDEVIKLKECASPYGASIWNRNYTNYCPDFSDEDFLYGDFYSPKFSWLRLVVH